MDTKTTLMLSTGYLQRYDVTSASVGALTVTSYCVWRGQDPATALSITLAATVAALVSVSADSICGSCTHHKRAMAD